MADNNDPLAQFKRAPTKEDPLAEFARPPVSKDEEMAKSVAAANQLVLTPPTKNEYGKQLGRAATATIPAVGMMIGGALATPESLGAATIPGAALGYATGKQIEDVANQYLLGDKPRATTLQENALLGLQDVGTGAMYEMGGQIAAPVIGAVAPIAAKGVSQGLEGISPYLQPSIGYASKAIPRVAGEAVSSISPYIARKTAGALKSVSEYPLIRTINELANPGATEDIATAIKMGERGINPNIPEHLQRLGTESAEATGRMAEQVGNVQRLGQAELEQIGAQEAKRVAAEQSAAANAKAYNAERTAAAKAEQAAAQKEAEAAQKAQRKAIEDEIKGKVEAERPGEIAKRQTEAEQAQEEVIKGGRALATHIQEEKKIAGKAIENAYNDLGKANFTYDPVNDIANIKNNLVQAATNDPNAAAVLNPILSKLDSFNKQLNADGIWGLKKTINASIDALEDNPSLQRQLINASHDLTDNIAHAAGNKGLKQIANNLSQANNNYTAQSLAQYQIGGPVVIRAGVENIPSKAISFVESLGKGVEGSSALTQQNRQLFGYLKQSNPEMAAKLEADLLQKAQAREATKANISDSQINNWFKNRIDDELAKLPTPEAPVVNLPQPSMMNVPEVRPADVEGLIAAQPELAPTLPAARRLTETLGEQAPLTAAQPGAPTEYQLGEGLKRLIEAKAKGPVLQPELVQAEKVLSETLPESAPALQKAAEARRAATVGEKIASTKVDVLHPLQSTSDVATKVANWLAYKGSKNSNLSSSLGKASNEALSGAAGELMQSPDVMHQTFGRMLKKASSEQGTSKAATLYLLSQNPEFRKMMEPKEEQ